MLRSLLRSRFAGFPPLLLLLIVGSFSLLAACGGGNDDSEGNPFDKSAESGSGSSSDATPRATSPSGGNPSSSGNTNAGTGDDKQYTKSLCVALDAYLTKFLDEAGKDPELLTDQAKTIKIAGPILNSLADDLSKAKPPRDVAQYHDDLVKNVRDVAKRANDGQITSVDEFAGISEGIAEPPAGVQERLSKAAEETPECSGSLLGGSLFGDSSP